MLLSDSSSPALASQIGGVLTGYVISQVPENSFVGFKETSSQRLYLRLTSDSGILLWRTELPYTIVKGAKGLDEERMTNALLTHVNRHAEEIWLGWAGSDNRAGYITRAPFLPNGRSFLR